MLHEETWWPRCRSVGNRGKLKMRSPRKETSLGQIPSARLPNPVRQAGGAPHATPQPDRPPPCACALGVPPAPARSAFIHSDLANVLEDYFRRMLHVFICSGWLDHRRGVFSSSSCVFQAWALTKLDLIIPSWGFAMRALFGLRSPSCEGSTGGCLLCSEHCTFW